ncbi:hypothetical protein M758_5G043100 [Ceratodon purpureus]|nr:hypothetical protein M758_5G043100 [Ceratodon purpureus]
MVSRTSTTSGLARSCLSGISCCNGSRAYVDHFDQSEAVAKLVYVPVVVLGNLFGNPSTVHNMFVTQNRDRYMLVLNFEFRDRNKGADRGHLYLDCGVSS